MQLTGPKGRLNTITLEAGKVFHTHRGVLPARRHHRPARRLASSSTTRRRAPRAPPAAQRLRHVDAARRRDRLPEGCRADPRPGRHLPGRDRRRGRRRLRRALALAAARDRAGRDAWCPSNAARSSPTSRAATSRPSSATSPPNWSDHARRPERGAAADGGAGVRRPRRARHARSLGVPGGRRAMPSMPGGVLLCYVATVTQLSRVAEAIRATGRVHQPVIDRDHGARLARRGPRRASRPPDDRPHRIPPHRPPPGARHRPAGAQAAPVEVRLQRRGCRAVDPGSPGRTQRRAPRACASACGLRARAQRFRRLATSTQTRLCLRAQHLVVIPASPSATHTDPQHRIEAPCASFPHSSQPQGSSPSA